MYSRVRAQFTRLSSSGSIEATRPIGSFDRERIGLLSDFVHAPVLLKTNQVDGLTLLFNEASRAHLVRNLRRETM